MAFILTLLSLAMITEIISVLLKGGGDDDEECTSQFSN